MSTWYKAGTASFANGSATVTGSGTSWVDNVKIGDALRAPDGRVYEIVEIVSSSELEIRPAYEGSSESNADYAIQPTRGILQRVFNQIQAWLDAAAGFGTAATEDDDRYVNVIDAQTIAGIKTFSDGIEADSYGGDGVTQSATDTTAGRLLKVGDFGVGAQPSDGDSDLEIDYVSLGRVTVRVDGTLASLINLPRRTNRNCQLAGATGGTAARAWVRKQNDEDDFTPWRELYHTGNLVGTVSQSGGDPTGAVIERGSNANGEYVRFADGTQMCWHSPSSVDLTDTSNQRYSFPASFTSADITCGASIILDGLFSSDENNRAISTAAVGTGHTAGDRGNWIFQVQDPGTSSDTSRLSLMAIGRWF